MGWVCGYLSTLLPNCVLKNLLQGGWGLGPHYFPCPLNKVLELCFGSYGKVTEPCCDAIAYYGPNGSSIKQHHNVLLIHTMEP